MSRVPSGGALKQVAGTAEGRTMLREKRSELVDRIALAEAVGQPVPRQARKLLKKLNRLLGEVAA